MIFMSALSLAAVQGARDDAVRAGVAGVAQEQREREDEHGGQDDGAGLLGGGLGLACGSLIHWFPPEVIRSAAPGISPAASLRRYALVAEATAHLREQ